MTLAAAPRRAGASARTAPGPVASEQSEQVALVTRLEFDRRTRDWFTHPANERASRVEAKVLRGMGVSPGVPDLLIFERYGGFCGMAIELKRRSAPPSSISAPQLAWLNRLASRGWFCVVALGHVDAWARVEEYLALDETGEVPGRLILPHDTAAWRRLAGQQPATYSQ